MAHGSRYARKRGCRLGQRGHGAFEGLETCRYGCFGVCDNNEVDGKGESKMPPFTPPTNLLDQNKVWNLDVLLLKRRLSEMARWMSSVWTLDTRGLGDAEAS